MITNENTIHAHELIDHIFNDLMPARGMLPRPAQISLSHQMLDAMLGSQISLCDAGTGTGKTYSYLVAGIAYHYYRTETDRVFMPILISTSSIALQSAIREEYLPLLSEILLEDGLIRCPITSVIRKGKRHYVCDQRLQQRLCQLETSKKNRRSMEELNNLHSSFDLDDAKHLSDYDKTRICVPELCVCEEPSCRYRDFVEHCSKARHMFQICNHNLLLANALHCARDQFPILQPSCAVIVDESHKLGEAARQMLGFQLDGNELSALIKELRSQRYLLAADYLRDSSKLLRSMLSDPCNNGLDIGYFFGQLHLVNETLNLLHYQLKDALPPLSLKQLTTVMEKIRMLLSEDARYVFYTDDSEDGGTALCCTIADLSGELRRILWSCCSGMILTSGTLAVGDDFSRFRAETGIPNDARVVESVTASPFDYGSHCLLYLPKYPIRQRGPESDKEYYDALTAEIVKLLDAANGHALVLFTSYSDMAAVSIRLQALPLRFRIYTMGRNAALSAAAFKEQSGGVLLATGAIWEGVDFPGDCVSLLIIPKLPFPIPDRLKEQQRKGYPNLEIFIREVIVPEMQIKLRQGFGRAIRTEHDTCAVAILDSRAKGKYHQDMLDALPKVPITSERDDITQFMLKHKPDRYFKTCCFEKEDAYAQ